MSIEERFQEAIEEEEDGEDVETGFTGQLERRRERLARKNKPAIERFMGKGRRTHDVGIFPKYYGELLTWALKRYMEEGGWQLVQSLGYHGSEPVYIDVNTNYDKRENLMIDGQLLVKKSTHRLIITVDVNMRWRNSFLVEGRSKKQTGEFVAGVLALVREQNFYRGKKIEFRGNSLRFLDLKDRSWESIILDEGTKKEIKANTTSFLRKKDIWESYGIPPKRGVLLAGEPGTGKTIICKALMAEADELTCISITAYAMDEDDYFTDLYELAEDLSPCLVFIEDIDLVGQNREEFGYQKGNALLSLLSVLDGIEEKKEIVTIATTNCLEMLDKALSQRPSRFDRVIRLPCPGLEERRELVSRLCRKIPLGEKLQEYVARRTEGCTPAQVQEVIHRLVIELPGERSDPATFAECDVDHILSRLNGRNSRSIGFCASPNHNGHKPDIDSTVKIA